MIDMISLEDAPHLIYAAALGALAAAALAILWRDARFWRFGAPFLAAIFASAAAVALLLLGAGRFDWFDLFNAETQDAALRPLMALTGVGVVCGLSPCCAIALIRWDARRTWRRKAPSPSSPAQAAMLEETP